nr:MAG TPA: hypothetical protein [Caudoviricetes sp.]
MGDQKKKPINPGNIANESYTPIYDSARDSGNVGQRRRTNDGIGQDSGHLVSNTLKPPTKPPGGGTKK